MQMITAMNKLYERDLQLWIEQTINILSKLLT